MNDYQERTTPAGPIGRAVRLMGPAERVLVFAGIPLAAAAGLQLMTQVIVLLLIGSRDLQLLGILSYLGLWGAPDPAARYGVQGAAILHWTVVIVLVVTIVATAVATLRVRMRWLSDPQRRQGMAEPKQVEAELGREQLVTVRGPVLRPALPAGQIKPTDVGYLIGTFRKIQCWARVEDPMILIGPSRAGKGWLLLLNWILESPGALITTSSKLDNAQLTMGARERSGSKVWIFAPGVPGGKDFGHVLRWDPVAGCVDEETLVRRLKALIPADSFAGSTSNGGHWDTLGQQLASHLFHAAACGGLTVDTIWDWVSSPRKAEQAVRLIREHPEGILEHAAHLETVINLPPEQRASQWGVLPTVLAFMESRAAREWMKPGEDEQIDLVRFILERGTLYLVGDKATTAGYLRILDGLLAELDHVTKGLAAASPGGRLDPPVTYLLDEAGNIEYQGLNELITAGGGRGRIGVAVFQSKAQLQQYGGQEAEATLWDAATVKILLPGGGDPRALEDISKLIGQTWVERESHSMGFTGPASVQLSAEKRAIFEESEIRTLEQGYAFVFYRNLKPVIAKCRPFSDHPRFAECQADEAALSVVSREASPYAAQLAEHQARRDA